MRKQQNTNPEDITIRMEQMRELLDSMLELPPRTAEVMVLFYLREKTRSHIAGMLGVSRQYVSAVISRGREQLRRRVKTKRFLNKKPDCAPV
jgi:RNA polymerase sigma factor (sigma-70 family)